jgi:hypothetical protein
MSHSKASLITRKPYEPRVQRWNSSLVMRLGQRFDPARRLSLTSSSSQVERNTINPCGTFCLEMDKWLECPAYGWSQSGSPQVSVALKATQSVRPKFFRGATVQQIELTTNGGEVSLWGAPPLHRRGSRWSCIPAIGRILISPVST